MGTSAGLSTTRTAGDTGHVADSNTVHGIVNKFDTALGVTSGVVPVGDGTTLTTRALVSTDIPGMVVNAQTGTTYTLVLTDPGKFIERNNASANTTTIPPNSSVAIPVGSVIPIGQYGAGTSTIVAGAGVTIRSRGALLALAGQYGVATIHKRATDEWWLYGDLA